MKSILFLRHAKSDWSNPGLTDFDRPLAKRGLKDAPRMGRILVRYGCMPDLVLSSPSLRTRQTVELCLLENGYHGETRWERSLYGGSVFDYLALIQSLPEGIENPLFVGHNPGLEETIGTLIMQHMPREHASSAGSHLHVPTAGLAMLDTDVTRWSEVKAGGCVLRWFLIPKLLKKLAP
jgi:phosphohistidine phosphatase